MDLELGQNGDLGWTFYYENPVALEAWKIPVPFIHVTQF